jgi:hypothetical protein
MNRLYDHTAALGAASTTRTSIRLLCSSLAGLALCIGASQRLAAQAYNYSENFNFFGDQVNVGNPGQCAGAAAINSFIFLENMYPSIYRAPNGPGMLTPNYNAGNNNDPTDFGNFATNGWQVGSNPARQGYYPRPGDANGDYVATLTDWFNDYAPGTSMLSSWYVGSTNNNRNATAADLAKEIKDGENVLFFITNQVGSASFYHVMTLVGVASDASGNITLKWQDPNNPSVTSSSTAITSNGQLQITNVMGAAGPENIISVFSESPVPEPAVLALVGLGLASLSVLRTRRKA